MKPENQSVMDGIMESVRGLSLVQRRTFLRAMSNPYFFLFAFRLAEADEQKNRNAYVFLNALMDRKEVTT